MLYELLVPLAPYFPGLNLFHYISFRAAFAAILSFLVIVVVATLWTIYLRRREVEL